MRYSDVAAPCNSSVGSLRHRPAAADSLARALPAPPRHDTDMYSNSSEMMWLKTEDDTDDESACKREPKITWNSEATMKLIEMFEKDCAELWDLKHPQYKDRNARFGKHEYLANKMGTTVEEINRKLHNLRSQFNNELRKIKKKQNVWNGSLQGASGWEYFDALLFLRNPNDGNEVTLPIEAVNIELAEFQANEELEFESAVRARLACCSPPRARRQYTRVAASAPPPLPPSAHPMMWPDSPQPRIRPSQNADECQIFGDFVASELRTLRSDESRKRLKRIIQKAVLNMGEEEDRNLITG